ncbi:MAG TPA: thioredoxin [Gaiellaceae bacterium]|nr:thioredoxin [Gaiellaceae bacterium]
MREVTDASFDQEVLRADRPVVVDFWAPWCGPCHALEPVLERLEDEAGGRVGFAKLNVDQNPLTASRYEVLALPTAILFAGGEARDAVVGARSPSHYQRAWATWLAASPTP